MKRPINTFFAALSYFTIVPSPRWISFSEDSLNRASGLFPLIGTLVGTVGAIVFLTANLILPLSISIVLSMVSTVLLTGALHEDGFADFCDAFGGGWNKEKILSIMKDSRLGTFGTLGLSLILLLKYLTLSEINSQSFVLILITGHTLSRFISGTMIYTHSHAYDLSDTKDLPTEIQKSKPLATKMTIQQLILSATLGLWPLILFFDPFIAIVPVLLYLIKLYFASYIVRWIGGYTGDCLGALQQITEIIFYILMVTYPWTFI
ncbi:MAG: adenosylcobinamide-GDP ribazoletransferase [Spirochaetota bacterium]|nr:adenosylcobinamide-GDP ribazoletransferase [Spirochaetota bacterium]